MTPENYHDASSHPWESIFAREGRVFTEKLPALDEMAAVFSAHRCRLVLDLGCGNGRHVIALSDLGFMVLGLDISRTGLELTRQWLGESELDASLLQADTRDRLPLADNSLDGILSTQVIHHALLEQVLLAISEIHRVLKPGGVAFVSVPCRAHSRRGTRPSRKIAPHTYLPLTGGEAGLPHYIFSKRRLRKAFQAFEIKGITERDRGRVLGIWVQKAA